MFLRPNTEATDTQSKQYPVHAQNYRKHMCLAKKVHRDPGSHVDFSDVPCPQRRSTSYIFQYKGQGEIFNLR